jgi:hypothetical protein
MLMELYLQFGWGMMKHCRVLCEEWGGTTVILSPRDLEPQQITRIAEDIEERGGDVLLDPQFYLPRADHSRLVSHQYWPEDYDTAAFADDGSQAMLEKLAILNWELGTSRFVVPGKRAESVDDAWLQSQRTLVQSARASTDQPLLCTLCLSSEAVRSMDQISLVMSLAEEMQVYGYYLVAERPALDYLTDDPMWLANTLDLVAGLRRQGAEVIVGYSSHQQLIMACAGADAIASGNWLNVRTFWPEKFEESREEEIRQRAVWYYCPQALSEYTLDYLDLAVARHGLAKELYPDPKTAYAEPLFSAPQPSASGWGEQDAFRHYLNALRLQVEDATRETYDATMSAHEELLDRAEGLLELLHERGIVKRGRDFLEALQANRSVLVTLDRLHGPLLERNWSTLT